MSIERVRRYLAGYDMAGEILEFEASCATVELAAQAAGVLPARIAKSITFKSPGGDGAIMIVAAGDAKIDNGRFKARFGAKASMLRAEEVLEYVGYAVGGVCPFDIDKRTPVFLDESLARFETVFPACGSENSMIQVTLPQLERLSGAQGWVDVCKNWR